ncbi:MAG: hypothetical protein NPIRA04_27840 [Nitrospirales bacterium]|nr:MAG: hypothetical protein NPIRA04_27840 [Nitrospirales bacterium]
MCPDNREPKEWLVIEKQHERQAKCGTAKSQSATDKTRPDKQESYKKELGSVEVREYARHWSDLTILVF